MSNQPPDSPGYGNAPQYGEGPQYGGGSPYGGGPPAPTTRPQKLDLAVKLMYVGAALSVLTALIGLFMQDELRESTITSLEQTGEEVTQEMVDTAVTVGIVLSLIMGLVFAAVWVLMAVMNGKGKKWARVVATVLGALGILFNLLGLFGATVGGTTTLSVVMSGVMIVLAAAILVLLWNKENTPYYEAMSAPRP